MRRSRVCSKVPCGSPRAPGIRVAKSAGRRPATVVCCLRSPLCQGPEQASRSTAWSCVLTRWASRKARPGRRWWCVDFHSWEAAALPPGAWGNRGRGREGGQKPDSGLGARVPVLPAPLPPLRCAPGTPVGDRWFLSCGAHVPLSAKLRWIRHLCLVRMSNAERFHFYTITSQSSS